MSHDRSKSLITAERYAKGVAIVAGGSGGIGSAICQELAAAGADIALTYHRNRDRAEAVAEQVRSLGRAASVTQLDMRDVSAVKAFASGAREQFGGIHTVVYAAGPTVPLRYVSQLSPQEVAETVGADVLGCFHLVHATLLDLRDARGAFIALGTAAASRYAKTDLLSAAPKAAVEVMVRAVAAEEGRFGVRANCIGVGMCTDGMYHELVARDHFNERFLAKTRSLIALERFGRASEIASVVSFLASDNASYVSGQFIMVDGGYAI